MINILIKTLETLNRVKHETMNPLFFEKNHLDPRLRPALFRELAKLPANEAYRLACRKGLLPLCMEQFAYICNTARIPGYVQYLHLLTVSFLQLF